MKVLFFGTPLIAVPFLDWLNEHHTVVGVVSRPDEPVGRGYKLTSPPTKVLAQKKNIPVFQPEGKWTEESILSLKDTGAEVGVAVAYGRLMPEPVFMAPKLGTFNIHFSLLPKYRGAGPMQWSLINGDKETGVTAFWIVAGMDSGPIFCQKSIAIAPDDNAITLKEKLITLGVSILGSVMADMAKRNIIKEPQQGEPTQAPQLKKEDGKIDWSKPAEAIHHLIAGVVEWPGASTRYTPEGHPSKQLKIFKTALEPNQTGKEEPGVIIEARKNGGIVVQTGQGHLLLEEVQPEGKKTMPAWSFWQGARLKAGDRFENK